MYQVYYVGCASFFMDFHFFFIGLFKKLLLL